MRGPVMPGREFFLQAFGRDVNEFKAILLMPELFIRNRVLPDWRNQPDYDKRLMPYVKEWMDTYNQLNTIDRAHLIQLLGENSKKLIRREFNGVSNIKVRKLLTFHLEENEIVSQYKNLS